MGLSLPTNVLSGYSESFRPLVVSFVGQRPDGLYVCHIVKHGRSSSFTCCRSIAMQYLNRMDHPEPASSPAHRISGGCAPSGSNVMPESIVTYLWLVIAWLVIVLVAAYATLMFIGLLSK